MLGFFEEALSYYRGPDRPLAGDALIALGRLDPLLEGRDAPHPWQTLWRAYRCHALCLAGRIDEAVALARSLVPVDVYEWVHVFECLFRAGRLDAIDLKSVLYRPPHAAEHRWAALGRRRMRADYARVTGLPTEELAKEYHDLIDEYDRGGLPFERALTRLSFGRFLEATGQKEGADRHTAEALAICRRYAMSLMAADAQGAETECSWRLPPRP
jgi:hypothetical protein